MCKAIKEFFVEKKARKNVMKMDDQTIDRKVKIQGTNFDRKRKYKLEFFAEMKSEYLRGVDVNDIAKRYKMSAATVKYNVDDDYRASYNAKRAKEGTHPIGIMDFENRVAYKRELIKTKQIKCAGLLAD